jgi:hypothetical protein
VTRFDPDRPAAPPAGVVFSDEEATLIEDAYIEALLASGSGAASLEAATTAPVDPHTARAVQALADGLVRFHPSFRFEERLAVRLREAARGRIAAGTSWVPGEPPVFLGTHTVGIVAAEAAGTGDTPVRVEADQVARGAAIGPFAIPDLGHAIPDLGHALPDIGREVGRAVERVERVPIPVLLGGAIASGVSLAGAAIVAWRLSRRTLLPRLP